MLADFQNSSWCWHDDNMYIHDLQNFAFSVLSISSVKYSADVYDDCICFGKRNFEFIGKNIFNLWYTKNLRNSSVIQRSIAEP